MKVRILTSTKIGDPRTGGATTKTLRSGETYELPAEIAQGLVNRGYATVPRARKPAARKPAKKTTKKTSKTKAVTPPENTADQPAETA
jgi:hypothetical protein